MITDTPKTQEEIIKFLPGRDIIRLMRNLEDSDASKYTLETEYQTVLIDRLQKTNCKILLGSCIWQLYCSASVLRYTWNCPL